MVRVSAWPGPGVGIGAARSPRGWAYGPAGPSARLTLQPEGRPRMKRTTIAALAAGLFLGASAFAVVGQAQTPPAAADALTDPALKSDGVIKFMGLRSGDRVADIIAGRFVRAESVAVGPKGKVYAEMPDEISKTHPEVIGLLKTTAADPKFANVELLTGPIDKLALPAK